MGPTHLDEADNKLPVAVHYFRWLFCIFHDTASGSDGSGGSVQRTGGVAQPSGNSGREDQDGICWLSRGLHAMGSCT